MRTIFTLLFCLMASLSFATIKVNFNSDWKLKVGDIDNAENKNFNDKKWKQITLPYAFNENEAFCKHIDQLTDTIMWYRKSFVMPKEYKNKKVFIEFEGVRQAADVYINGHKIGISENGVMAFGFDLTPYIDFKGKNVLSLRIDNSWRYRERSTNTLYQWNNKNFNANYGGIPKNVWLHIGNDVYQTLPLYSNLKTTGVYIYADGFNIKEKTATIHAESEIMNESKQSQNITYEVEIIDTDGKSVSTFKGSTINVKPNQKAICKASKSVDNLHFWSWGYGYLYTVKTRLLINGQNVDEVSTRTGFRKTKFADGKIWLNDRVIQMKGFAQRTSNEWPGVGMSVPAWLSDYSNGLMVKDNANLVRWMHVTPWKQDIESCDRVGLIQAMQAGDAEKDCQGEQWRQRKDLMRDAIIYNRNNPSILFYESGNESISREHMIEMKNIRNLYDPNGGRAIGSREMLDIREAEYGGEMLYINKSKHHPMWAMEYCRDEGLRKYWDSYSYPYHKEGAGPLYRNADASDYNHNQDMLAVENVRRWYDYYRERPGTGTRVSSGGVKIIFSDTNTHCRGEENYRRSGVTDAMRIPKDAYFVHQAMWDGWVDTEKPHTYIIGHWNYTDSVIKPVYVVSTSNSVELFLNGKSLGTGKREYNFLHTFENVKWEKGELVAIGKDINNNEESRDVKRTAGLPKSLSIKWIDSPLIFRADGADMRLGEIEAVDENGARCPLDNRMIHFEINGPAEWIGGIAQGKNNCILSKDLPLECGVNRFLIKSTNKAGNITITAKTEGLPNAELSISTAAVNEKNGFYINSDKKVIDANWGNDLPVHLQRGETPLTPSYKETMREVEILSATSPVNQKETCYSYDDNELTEWKNDGRLENATITYKLSRKAKISDICIKLTGWRSRSYPIDIYANDNLVWSGDTEKSLGYIHLAIPEVESDCFTIKLRGKVKEKEAFGQIVELAEPVNKELDLYKSKNGNKTKSELRIVEIEFLEKI